jgi:hypothetical protein
MAIRAVGCVPANRRPGFADAHSGSSHGHSSVPQHQRRLFVKKDVPNNPLWQLMQKSGGQYLGAAHPVQSNRSVHVNSTFLLKVLLRSTELCATLYLLALF